MAKWALENASNSPNDNRSFPFFLEDKKPSVRQRTGGFFVPFFLLLFVQVMYLYQYAKIKLQQVSGHVRDLIDRFVAHSGYYEQERIN